MCADEVEDRGRETKLSAVNGKALVRRKTTHFGMESRDLNCVWNDESCHPLLDRHNVREWDYDL